MNQAVRVAGSIMTGFVIAVVIASSCIVAYSQHQRAHRAEDEVAAVRAELAETNMDLQMAKADVKFTDTMLTQAVDKLRTTEGTLVETAAQRDASGQVAASCGYLARATEHLVRRDRLAAQHQPRRAARHAKAMRVLVRRTGYGTLTALARSCRTPTER